MILYRIYSICAKGFGGIVCTLIYFDIHFPFSQSIIEYLQYRNVIRHHEYVWLQECLINDDRTRNTTAVTLALVLSVPITLHLKRRSLWCNLKQKNINDMICMRWLRAKSPEGFISGLSKTGVILSIAQLQQTASYRHWVIEMIQDKSVHIPLFTEWMLIRIKALGGNRFVARSKLEIEVQPILQFEFYILVWFTLLCRYLKLMKWYLESSHST